MRENQNNVNIDSIRALSQYINKFCSDRDWDQFHSPKDLCLGLLTEASELAEIFRFKSEKQINEMFLDKSKNKEIADELADVLFFVLRSASLWKIDLSKAFDRKMEKNQKKYPVELCKGKNLKYSEYTT